MAERSETIAAIATAPGRGGVAVIRVSGADAFQVARAVTRKEPEAGRVVFSRFFLDGKVVDEGLVLSFKAPRSFTGEDVVEFQCHGGSVTPSRILDAAIAAGARLARRGEFTERAFLNGKMTYEQAEALLDLIDAKTEKAADSALADMVDSSHGAKANPIRKLYDDALKISSEIEHSLDVDESDLSDEFFGLLASQVRSLDLALAAEIKRLREKRILRDGVSVVLLGPPNAGKSSLMNALLGESRAIVSETAGTTRDSIEAWIDIGGWPIKLIDTAGIRHEGADFGTIEAEGVRRSEALAKSADVVIDFGGGTHDDERVIAICAKCDLKRGSGLNVSAFTGEGISDLRREIVSRLERLADKGGEGAESAAEKNLAALERARAILSEADFSFADAVLLGNVMRRTAATLGEVLGAEYSEDLLASLFSRFCVGK
ncbi:MAG: tRNA modification GTPase [Kiritimatiellae bacterium]|nr:tRNA modification GTPase [Kiritimatiellia bacterium]